MKKKTIKRQDIRELGLKPKKIDTEKVFKLIKKIGTPYDPPSSENGNYRPA